MIRLTKITDYGVGLMVHLADCSQDVKATALGLSEELKLPLPTVRKVLKILTRSDLLVSHRGVTGGYTLAKSPHEITLMDIVTALEGPVALTECATGSNCECDREEICNLKGNWNWVNNQMQQALAGMTLYQMAVSMPPFKTDKNEQQADLQDLA